MASSNNSKIKTPKSETKTPKSETKTKKERHFEKEKKEKNKKSKKKEEEEKEENKITTKNNKKLKLSNGDSKQQEAKRTPQKMKHDVEEEEEEAKTHVFPLNRIRTMIKGEDPEARVSPEAILAINKAAEKFLEQFTQDSYTRAVQDRKTYLSYNHLAHVVSKQRRYDFLSDFIPEKVKAEDALREISSRGNGGG